MSKINKLIPHYDRGRRRWRVEFTDRAPEEGDLLYVASEYAWSGLYFPYNTSQTIGKEYSGHSHSFQGVLHALMTRSAFRLQALRIPIPSRNRSSCRQSRKS